MAIKICPCCGENFQPHHKVPNQTYCSSPECQKERRQGWDRKKQKSDPDYLQQHHADILTEFKSIVEAESLDA